MQIQMGLFLQKPTDLDLNCLQRQDISGFSRTRVNNHILIVAPVTFAPAGMTTPSAEFLFLLLFFQSI